MNRIQTKKIILQKLRDSDIPQSIVSSIYKILISQQPEDFVTEHAVMDQYGNFRQYEDPTDNDGIVEMYFY